MGSYGNRGLTVRDALEVIRYIVAICLRVAIVLVVLCGSTGQMVCYFVANSERIGVGGSFDTLLQLTFEACRLMSIANLEL